MGQTKGSNKYKGKAKRTKSKKEAVKVDPLKMNAGGFYEGMPGCTLDKWGNRKMIGFFIEEKGYANAYLHCMPQQAKAAIQDVMDHNPMIKGVVRAAMIDQLFSSRNPLNWPFMIRYRIYLWWKAREYRRKLIKKQAEEMKKRNAEVKGQPEGEEIDKQTKNQK